MVSTQYMLKLAWPLLPQDSQNSGGTQNSTNINNDKLEKHYPVKQSAKQCTDSA